jgi:hypothetical protein
MRSVNILAFAGIVAALCVPGPSKHKTTLSLQLEEDKPNPAMLSTHKPEETKKLLPFLQPGGRIETDTNWGSFLHLMEWNKQIKWNEGENDTRLACTIRCLNTCGDPSVVFGVGQCDFPRGVG